MFTGIVQHLGRVAALDSAPFGAVLQVDSSGWSHQPSVGDSIAVNGCCLTVAAAPSASVLGFDVVRQTLDATAMGDLRVGDVVNLEHAVTPQAMLGGHIVQGHVDGVGQLIDVCRVESEHRLRIKPVDIAMMDCVIEKGSIAVDGVSLTVARSDRDWLEVALIPTTLRLTNLAQKRAGARVNLETDYLAKIVVNYLKRSTASSMAQK